MAITKVSASLVDLDGGVVINESSADADFRVESNGNANMLFVDGGNDRVGINGTGTNARGSSNTVALFDVSGSGKNYVEIQGATDSTANGLLFSDGSSGNYGVLGYDHANDVMNFFTASSERMRLASDGDLFLNTTSAMDNCFASFQDGNNGEAMVGISAKNDNNVGIRFGVGTTRKWVNYRDTSDNLIWYSNAAGAERVRFYSGGGITFNGDNAAANALDDYEEGTWTPAAGPGSSQSYAYRSGNYTKVGRMVTAYFGFLLNGGTFTSSEATISGLPFAVQTTGSYQEPQFVIYTYGAGPTGITGAVGASNSLIPGQITFYLNGGESQGRGRKFTTNADAVLPGNEAFDSNTFIKGVVIYYTA
jgi:prepilin-type processing-associated H-X9-DG protein